MTTSDAPTARVGIYNLYKTGPSTFVLTNREGVTAGTFPTALSATNHAIALIAAARKA